MSPFRQIAAFGSLALLGFAVSASEVPQIVKATLLSNAIQLDTRNVKPGPVTFDVHNSSDDKMTHELVVLKTELPDDALPVRKGRVAEEKFRKIGEVEDVAPGKSKKLVVKLAPGHYVLLCNKPDHYSMGMHTSLVVAP
ncbi:conserved exported hypothetical protein [Paraburkholderia piptadeniae]|uniref:Blue (type 1) copper domain-containing protein n=1 Tax=Paraburkholderia piptadeniae TaxID=1701573 RepID=A0A1N7SEF4_9BURK|nr:plastocyanin/azurin family copper-binding protein [Paraburkholderia piptadeniae]SIT45766.1 conserved exported hypothetical protein [Paraburkholderia piptadeniae]